MPLLDAPQRSEAWYSARAGRITASLAAAVLGLDPHRGPLSAWREITGGPKQADNKHMAWGRQFEAEARTAYENLTGNLVLETGSWVHEQYDWLSASPDGLIDADGLLEVKCPGKLPEALPVHHQIQMQVQLACTGRVWCDYFAYVPGVGFLMDRVVRSYSAEDDLISKLRKFYETYVVTGVEPPRKRGAS